jgi:N-acetylneuraminate synthase/N,N'-diacetyllegionaminate synthase
MILNGRDLKRERLLVAEIGNNHEGDAVLALEMVAAAAEAGADAVKIQVIEPERLVRASEKERVAQLSRFKLPRAAIQAMAELARAKGILFVATPFDPESLAEIVDLVAAVKIASGDLDYVQLLSAAARTGKPMILSTGMGTLEEVEKAVAAVALNLPAGKSVFESLALLHCVSAYPTPLHEANLVAIETLAETFGLTTGYSDHTLGIEAALVAACLGARIIEKHFTLDKNRASYRDHALSADPADIGRLAAAIHSLDKMMGDGKKRPGASEQSTLTAARRSVVAARDLPAGANLTPEDLDFVRPGNGLPPSAARYLVGRRLAAPVRRHELVLEKHFAAEKRGNFEF